MGKLPALAREDGKSLAGSRNGWIVLIVSILAIGFFYTTLLPLMLLYVLYRKTLSPFPPMKNIVKGSEKIPTSPATDSPPRADRGFDLVVLGATGYTGRLAAIYLAENYPVKVSWAIAGRSQKKLEAVRAELAAIDDSLADLPLLIVDNGKRDTLVAMAKRTRAVISTVGPFAKYGTLLVEVCAEYGTHYCDITGEFPWFRQMRESYGPLAEESGARLVSFCGHDCVPWELSVSKLAARFQDRDTVLSSVEFRPYLRGGPSGGTIQTMFHSLASMMSGKKTSTVKPRLIPTTVHNKSPKLPTFSSGSGMWQGPFVMSSVLVKCINFSNSILHFSDRVEYSEGLIFPNLASTIAGFASLHILIAVAVLQPLQRFVQGTIMPAPGQGPTPAENEAGFLCLEAIGTAKDGSTAKSTMYFPKDPGYKDTARMLVESGLVLALQEEELDVEGGFWTSSTCQKELLLKRLLASGTKFVEE